MVAARFGESRQTFHTWLSRYRDSGSAGLMDRTAPAAIVPTPGGCRGGGPGGVSYAGNTPSGDPGGSSEAEVATCMTISGEMVRTRC